VLRWAIAFFIIALLAAVLGFTGIAVAAAGIAKILFYIFLILFLISLLGGVMRRT
jgi:uncharacterized membrane protein YtjA (UPF0391 family)